MKMKKFYILTVILLSLALVLAACGGNDGNAGNNGGNNDANAGSDNSDNNNNNDGGDDSGGDAGDAMGSIPADAVLDPATSDNEGVLAASSYVYDTLVRVEGGEIVGGLAQEWDVSDDGLTYTFRLRASAVFSDGTPIGTDIVTANFNRWFDPENALHGSDSSVYLGWQEYFKGFRYEVDADEKPLSLFDGIEKDDNLRFLIHLYEPMDNFLEIIAMPQFSILHPDYIGSADVVGTGMYVVASWDGDSLVLSPNPAYWGSVPSGDVTFTVE